MRIRSPSGWGLRKRAGEAAAPLFPPTANRRQAVLAREPRIRVDGQDANAAPTRFPVGTTAMNPSTAPAYPKAGLSKCRFQPQVFTRLFHVKHLFQPSLCCAKQTSPGKIRQGRRPGNVSPCIPPRSEWRKSIEFGRTRLIEPARCASLESSRFHDLRRCQSKLASARAALFDTSEFNLFSPFGAEECAHRRRRGGGGGRVGGRGPGGGRAGPGRARLTRDRAPTRRTGRTRG